MSKGIRLAIRKKEPIVRVRQNSPSPDSGTIIDLQPQACWTFSLVENTEAAQQVARGTFVFGIKQDARILILADLGLIGFVPSPTATKINAAIEIKGGELRGEVLSISPTKTSITVKVCLY